MTEYQNILAALSLLTTCFQYGFYIKDIIRHRTRPHAFSWFIWGFPTLVIFFAQFLNHAGAGSWATALTGIFCVIIFLLSLWYGEKNITRSDRISLLAALLAMALWLVAKDPLGTVILITVIDIVGFIPTMRKSIMKPHEETLSTYVLGGTKWILSILCMAHFSWIVLIYPVAMVFTNWLGACLIVSRRASLAIHNK